MCLPLGLRSIRGRSVGRQKHVGIWGWSFWKCTTHGFQCFRLDWFTFLLKVTPDPLVRPNLFMNILMNTQNGNRAQIFKFGSLPVLANSTERYLPFYVFYCNITWQWPSLNFIGLVREVRGMTASLAFLFKQLITWNMKSCLISAQTH